MDTKVDVLSISSRGYDEDHRKIGNVIQKIDSLIRAGRYEEVPFTKEFDEEGLVSDSSRLVLYSKDTQTYVLYSLVLEPNFGKLKISVGVPYKRKSESGIKVEGDFLKKELSDYL